MEFFKKNKFFITGGLAGIFLQLIVFCILRFRINYSYYLYFTMFLGMLSCVLIEKYAKKKTVYHFFPLLLFSSMFFESSKILIPILFAFGSGASIYICSSYILPEKEGKGKSFLGGIAGFVLGMIIYIF
ncbi:MAG: hypothetical protein FWD82_05640 [Defluviitaleaceae bacterium]|nr:hypothetical protein [Defluviitaleaceae bacterium]